MPDDPRWIVHLALISGRLDWSGYNATGDLKRHKAFVHRIDVGGEFRICHEGRLIIDRVSLMDGFTPGGLVLATKAGMYGLKFVEGTK